MIGKNQLNWLVTAFFAVIIAVVFQQIYTSMTEQGIATGGPYDNGAAYPRAVAIAIAALVIGQLVLDKFKGSSGQNENEKTSLIELRRPALLLVFFAIYLGVLSVIGYHLATTPLIFAIMWLCGARVFWKLMIAALVISFSSAYVFETVLNVVLPGGVFNLNIPW
jgi:putative tricarboxylic transport membrane protein